MDGQCVPSVFRRSVPERCGVWRQIVVRVQHWVQRRWRLDRVFRVLPDVLGGVVPERCDLWRQVVVRVQHGLQRWRRVDRKLCVLPGVHGGVVRVWRDLE